MYTKIQKGKPCLNLVEHLKSPAGESSLGTAVAREKQNSPGETPELFDSVPLSSHGGG